MAATAFAYRQNIPLAAGCLLAFVIPLPYQFGAIGVIAVSATALIFRGKEILQNLRYRKLIWLWLALYIWYGCSWYWSENKAEAQFQLMAKLSLLLLPIFVGCSGLYERKNLRKVLFAFALGTVAAGIYCFWNAWNRYQLDKDVNHFFYHQLISGLDANAVYMAWYVVTALLFLLLEPLQKSAWAVVRLLLLCILLPFFVLLAARTLLLFFVLVALPVTLFHSFRKRVGKAQKALIWTFAAGVVVAGFFALQQPAIQYRFRELHRSEPGISFLKHYHGEEEKFSNMNIRLFLWRVGLESMTSSPEMLWQGAGIGDAHQVSNQRIKELGIPRMEEKSPDRSVFYNINMHNTFIHTGLSTGLVGMLLVLLAAVGLVFVGAKTFRENPFELLFALLSLLFMMQEAILETQAGVVFYLFVYSLLVDSASHMKSRSLFRKLR